VIHAFAEALLPGGQGLPPAGEEGVEVVEPLSSYLAHVPSRLRLGLKLATRAFEHTTFPRRFSRLPLERRRRHLESLSSRPGGLRRELFLLLKTLAALSYARDARVHETLGMTARCRLADGATPARAAPPLDPAAMTPPGGVERCDVAIVGSGAGGAAAARVLAEAGLSVIVLEAGDYHDASSYTTDPLESMPRLYRDGGLTMAEGLPAIPLPLGRCVGGTTVINSGTCLRTPDDVLGGWRERHGIPWATDLEREFESLERDLLVTPVDPAAAGRNAELCRAGAEALGASNGPIARNAGPVVCCGTCPGGCELDAKQAVHVSELPRAAAAGCVVRAGATVERVIVESGRAAGVVCETNSGPYEVRARAVVLAAGAVGTPELLLSQGIANSSGRVGRGLKIHPACWVGARYDEQVRGWEGVMQSWYVDEWKQQGLFLEATFTPFTFGAHWLPGSGDELMERLAGYDRLAVIGVHLSDRTSGGRVRMARGRPRITYRLGAEDAKAIRFGIARAAEIHFAAGATEVFPHVGGVSTVSSVEQARAIDNGRVKALDLRLEAFHPMGTARMGADSAASVVAPSGETHDLPGLYVADASIFPTSLRVNPMITIMACSRRIAAGIADSLT
jgi:choline dehydrogenase-like flavoprotein